MPGARRGCSAAAISRDRRLRDPGNPAAIGPLALRPEALRPHLSMGLPLVARGDRVTSVPARSRPQYLHRFHCNADAREFKSLD